MADRPLQQQSDQLLLPVYEGAQFRASSVNSQYALEQLYVNGWPEPTTQDAGEWQDWSYVVRPGTNVGTAMTGGGGIISTYGTSDTMVCIANTVITQLYDVYVAAFFDSTNSHIYIVQYRPIALTTTLIGTITGCNNGDLVFITEIQNADGLQNGSLGVGFPGGTLIPAIAISYQKADRSGGTGYYSRSNAGVFTGDNVFTGSQSTTTLTISGVTSGILRVGDLVTGTNIPANTIVLAVLTGTVGGVGTYTVSTSATAGSTTVTATSLQTIKSASFPSNLATPRIITGPFQQMNGLTYIATIDGFIFDSLLDYNQNPDVSLCGSGSPYTNNSWNTQASVTATQYPDRLLGVYRYKQLLLAVGQDSIEFWSPDNNAPPQSSLIRTDQAFIKFGALSPKLVATFNDILYWVTYGTSDTLGVWKMDGYTPSKISTPREDYHIIQTFQPSSLTYTANCYSLEMLLIENKQHLLVNGVGGSDPVTANPTIIAYNLVDSVWWQFELNQCVAVFPATSFGSAFPASTYTQYFFARKGTDSGNSILIASGTNLSTTPTVMQFVTGTYYYTDFGVLSTTIPWVMQLNTKRFTTDFRKRINKVILHTDGGQHNTVYCVYIKNGVNGTTITRAMEGGASIPGGMGAIENARRFLNNLGTCRSLFLRFYGTMGTNSGHGVVISDNQLRITGVELSMAQGTH